MLSAHSTLLSAHSTVCAWCTGQRLLPVMTVTSSMSVALTAACPGATNTSKRQGMCDVFQADPSVTVALLSLKCGGLSGASILVQSSASVFEQAQD